MSPRKTKDLDIGSRINFGNVRRAEYSLSEQKDFLPKEKNEQIVRIGLEQLEAAPEEWNFYPALEGEEFYRLVRSILVHGLLHPIVVENKNGKNIILSGHNRVRAYKYIQSELQRLNGQWNESFDGLDVSNIKVEDFREIFAIVKENISETDAREIIIDANYAQRQLGPKLLTRSIIEKYKIIQAKRREDSSEYKNRKTREIVAESFQMSGRHIDRYKKLENLDKELLELFYEGKLSLETSAKLSVMKPEIQKEIIQNYLDVILKYPTQSAEYFKPSMGKKDLQHMKEEILAEKKNCRISFLENGVHKNVVLYEEHQIAQVIALIKSFSEENSEE